VDNQVIVIGPKQNIRDVLQIKNFKVLNDRVGDQPAQTSVGTQLGPVVTSGTVVVTTPGLGTATIPTPTSNQLTLVLIEDCDMSYLGALSLDNSAKQVPLPQDNTKQPSDSLFTDAQRKNSDNPIVMQLYEIRDSQAAPLPTDSASIATGVISTINNNQASVFADPNYLVDLSDLGSCGTPFSGGGSPFSGGGSPYAEPGIPSTNVSGEFLNQWALGGGVGGINITATLTGNGIQIGVFDTAPFGVTNAGATAPSSVPNPFSAQPTDLTGSNFAVTDAITNPLDSIGPPAIDIRDHGLFVAGLIHAVAKGSNIELIQVLNDDGCGDLFTIDKAINDFVSQKSDANGKLNKVVLNLSLGVHHPDELAKEKHTEVEWAKFLKDVASLQTAIGEALHRGGIVVAAAGNDSADSAGPYQMQLPAAIQGVLGVAATNSQGIISCYSNIGDVAAPGGDGGSVTVNNSNGTSTTNPCAPRASTWNIGTNPCNSTAGGPAAMAQCQYGVISLSWDKTANHPGYIFWVGTSFSTPLVTGLAALAFESKAGDRVKALCLIQHGAANGLSPDPIAGWGLINVANSLNTTACP